MGLLIQIASWLLWFPLKILGITALLRVGVRRYPLIFAFMVVSFLFAAVQAPLSFAFHRADRNAIWYQLVNSVGQVLTTTLMLAVVVTFLHRASSHLRSQRMFVTGVIVLTVLLGLGSFAMHHDPRAWITTVVTPWTRDVHFWAALLDLVAWGMLVAKKDRDSRLLLLTGGMGIMFAGEAIGGALRSISNTLQSYPLYYSAHAVKVLADAIFLYIWWQTFRNEAIQREKEEKARAMVRGK